MTSNWVHETRMAFGQSGSKKPVAYAAGWAIAVAACGGLITEIGPWYWGLKKPWFQPPDWLFGPAWTIIFALSATAAVYAWRRTATDLDRRAIVIAYVVNGVFNVFWSLLFFKLHRPDWALWEVTFLWVSILVMIWTVRRFSTLAAWFVVPYLLWVSFASVLNYSIVQLNQPF